MVGLLLSTLGGILLSALQYAIVTEARRIANKYKPPLPIFPYTKFEYDPLKKLDSFYNDSDICTTIKQPADLGVDGLVFWSSSSNMTQRCENIENYLKNTFGPIVKNVVAKVDECRQSQCSGHGKCVIKKLADKSLLTNTCSSYTMSTDNYYCLCDPQYNGDKCSIDAVSTTS